MTLLFLLAALLFILLAALLFTEALEAMIALYGLHHGFAASVLAAVATALPETLVPVVALLGGGHVAVATGAILGAPWMLSTLSLGLLGVVAASQRGWWAAIDADPWQCRRDMGVFLLGFGYALICSVLPLPGPRAAYALPLLLLYGAHVRALWKLSASSAAPADSPLPPLSLMRLHLPVQWAAPLQVLIALVLLIGASHLLVEALETLALRWSISPLLLSLLLVPVATELPEKLNSIIWLSKGQDSLALGNITGALAFQGCLLPALGILASPWRADSSSLLPALLTWGAGLWLWICGGQLRPLLLLPPGLLYLGYLLAAWLNA